MPEKIILHIFLFILIGNSLFAQNRKREKEISLAENLEQIADSLLAKEEYRDAVGNFHKAALLFEKNKFWIEAVMNYRQTAWCYMYLNNIDSSQYFIDHSYNTFIRKLKSLDELVKIEESEIYYTKARIYKKLNELDSTFHYLDKGLVIVKLLNDTSRSNILLEAKYCQTLGSTNYSKGSFDDALKFNFKALNLRQKKLKSGHSLILNSYYNIAIVYYAKRDYKKASENFWYVINNCPNNDKIWEANSYNYLGAIQQLTSEYKDAITYFNSALDIYKEITGEKSLYVALCMNNIGQTYLQLKDYEKAYRHLKISIQIMKENLGEEHSALSQYLLSFGKYFYEVEDYNEALKIFNEALTILNMNKSSDRLTKNKLYNFIGLTYLKTSKNNKAVQYFQKAICELINNFEYTENLNDPEIFFEGTNIIINKIDILSKPTLYDNLINKAYANHQVFIQDTTRIKNLLQSLNTYKLVFKLLNNIRLDISEDESKFTLSNIEKKYLIDAIDVCFKLDSIIPEKKYSQYALRFIENLKSASLQDKSNILNALTNSNIPEELLEKEKKMAKSLAYYKTEINKNRQASDTNLILEYKNKYTKLGIENDTICNYLEKKIPKYYKQSHYNEFNLDKIKSGINKNEMIIEYFVASENLLIVTIDNEDFEIVKVKTDSSFKENVLKFSSSIRKIEVSNYKLSNSALYEKLITPIKHRIESKKALIIIPDDYLYYIPFEALYDNKKTTNVFNFVDLNYLIKDYEIRYNYSLSFWNFTKNIRKQEVNYSGDFIGFAPVFEDDEIYTVDIETNDSTTRSVLINGKRFSKLLYTKKEISEISNLFSSNEEKASTYFYNDATEENFKKNINGYKYIHISTHGFSDEINPNLSGLAFYKSKDIRVENQGKTEDGLLYSGEISSLDLNADLVVLSACETGIGKLIDGEGLIAINRSFMHSGVPNTIYSLWSVADKNTSELMIGFYKEILSGKTYSQALRETKLNMIKDTKTCFPKNWSSFVLVGI